MRPQACIQVATFQLVAVTPASFRQGQSQRRRCGESDVASILSRSDVRGFCRRHLQRTVPSWTSSCQRRTIRIRISASGSSEKTVERLRADEVVERLRAGEHAGWAAYKAMYSSVLGGIVTDPALMVLPMDDHMVHRGHAVFDTTTIWKGHLYEADSHLNRLLRSSAKARLKLPFPREELLNIITETAAASGVTNGTIRYWASAGPGGFGLSMTECIRPSFYVVVSEVKELKDHSVGVSVVTSSVSPKAPQFATAKNVNYLPNVLVLSEAEERGAYAGVWLDDEGYIAEGPNMNIAFVTEEGELLVPSFDKILSGCTIMRTLDLLNMVHSGVLSTEHGATNGASNNSATDGSANGGASHSASSIPVKKVTIGKVTVERAKAAKEVLLFSSSLYALPVVSWDGSPVGDGKVGPASKWLHQLILNDMERGPADVRIQIPYRDPCPIL